MTFLLDTNAWLRLYHEPHLVSPEVRQRLDSEPALALSPFSIIELAQKQAHPRKRITLGQPLHKWLIRAMPPARIHLLPITPEIALRAYGFVAFHGDPADRIIAATAVEQGLTLVTSDQLLIDHPEVPTLSTL